MKTLVILLLGAGIVLAVLNVPVMGFELLFSAMVAAMIVNRSADKN